MTKKIYKRENYECDMCLVLEQNEKRVMSATCTLFSWSRMKKKRVIRESIECDMYLVFVELLAEFLKKGNATSSSLYKIYTKGNIQTRNVHVADDGSKWSRITY